MDKDTRNILLGCLIALVIIVGVIYAIKYFEKRDYYSEDQDSMDSYYRENSIKVDIETNKKTEYKDYLLHDGNILVEVHNENGYNTSARIYVEFFDSNKETIAIRDGYINYIGSHKKAYEEIAVEKGLQDLYETYEVKVMSSYEYEKYTLILLIATAKFLRSDVRYEIYMKKLKEFYEKYFPKQNKFVDILMEKYK